MATIMNIGIYSPYLPKHFGGGEKHILTTAWYLSQRHTVSLLLPEVNTDVKKAIKEYENLFGIDLSSIQLQVSGLAKKTHSPWQNWQETKKFDAFFYLTDGSFFFAGSKKNILHIQVPFTNKLSLVARLKLFTWNVRNANSRFTQSVVEKNWQTTIPFIHYPFADTKNIHFSAEEERKKTILSVGRFIDPIHADLHSKRQDALVSSFIDGCMQHHWHKKGWQLLLVGAVEPDGVHQAFVQRLKKQAADWPIVFAHKVDAQTLSTFYKESDLYWHAAGLDIDENLTPAKVEHFGMAPVEAMAHGCLPLLTNKGGLKEVVGSELASQFLFSSQSDLVGKTNMLMLATKSEKQTKRQLVRKQAENFSLERFCQTIDTMLGEI